jgi:hypothetical protein
MPAVHFQGDVLVASGSHAFSRDRQFEADRFHRGELGPRCPYLVDCEAVQSAQPASVGRVGRCFQIGRCRDGCVLPMSASSCVRIFKEPIVASMAPL